ncbi:MAG: M61 family metallopeptidase [Gammaproteobacteria bacterium]|jgi:predicted metalloprotease with PDZ domain|nr:M61 family metallopeptidase [Gammaproteobacteria bacterium]MBT3723682.1 M61 family metallopeptidase [Gammaproteobacteria bacterium]MBT4075117.1 M61 family metallopeptidase [Gammaproteobacteria bacterium]MBT4194005.1 M61 family metallopeptidase [Gammaproteobacteria bacterium]MBT4448648.1 M61 family metallopeptidase [Gammaproteobacteria bacterium]
MIHYKISSANPAGHYFDISLTIPAPDPSGQVLRLPAWIPGSYMIRDFARNIIEIDALCNNALVVLTQQDKSSWLLENCEGPATINYRVYAWDLSVRTAHLDTTHGFFNGTSVFLEVVGQSQNPCSVEIVRPDLDDGLLWQVATTLTRVEGSDFEFGLFQADNYQELIDHPVEMGQFTQLEFMACGIRHDVILTGRFQCDEERLSVDLIKICEQHIKMFGEPAPMSRYMFLVMVVGDGYGGLEHRSSTSLLCSRKNLPQPGQSELTEEYRSFLGLCSHEYFHSWNVKRIKPAVFDKPDLSQEVYTPLLWAFEGITSYYDDLALLRCGCISRENYFELLGQTLTRVERGTGKTRQSAAESSFNAWSKFYKQDENAANAIVSYYAKGTLIALCIDLKIRQMTDNQRSLDDVMRILWSNFLDTGNGLTENEIQNIINQLVETDLSDFLHQLIYQHVDLPVKELLEFISVKLDYRESAGQQDKGGKAKNNLPACSMGANVKDSEAGLTIVSVKENAAAQKAGISAGDTIIAINGLRANLPYYQSWLKLAEPGSKHRLVCFRRDELMNFELELLKPEKDTAVLTVIDESNSSFNHWAN